MRHKCLYAAYIDAPGPGARRPKCPIRAGLRLLLEERRWREEVRRKIAEGMAQAKAGQLADGDEVFERLRKRIDLHRTKGA